MECIAQEPALGHNIVASDEEPKALIEPEFGPGSDSKVNV